MGEEAKRQPPLDEARARELLLNERARVERALAALRRAHGSEVEEIDTATDPADDAELIEEGQVDEALAEQLQRELGAIDRALDRLEKGSYGFSIESGEPIPAGRLEAVPWAERTAEEQRRFEAGGHG